MEELPKTTLTQRRTEVLSGAKKLTKSKLDHEDEHKTPDRSAVIRIAIWIAVVVLIGIGSALFLTQFLNGQNRLPANNSNNQIGTPKKPDSLPVVGQVVEDTDVDPTTPAVSTPPNTPPATVPQTNPAANPLSGSQSLVSLAEYANTDRAASATTAQSTLILNKVKYFETVTEFNYQLFEVKANSGMIDPAISISYEGNDVIFSFKNVSKDSVIGEEKSFTRAFTNVVGITRLLAENKASVSSFRFTLTKKVPVRVVVDKEAGEVLLQIDNR